MGQLESILSNVGRDEARPEEEEEGTDGGAAEQVQKAKERPKSLMVSRL